MDIFSLIIGVLIGANLGLFCFAILKMSDRKEPEVYDETDQYVG